MAVVVVLFQEPEKEAREGSHRDWLVLLVEPPGRVPQKIRLTFYYPPSKAWQISLAATPQEA